MDLTRIATRVVHASRSRPWLVIAVILVLAIGSAFGAVRTLAINTDTTALFDADLPFRVAERAFDVQFPGEIELVVTVIDAPSAARAPGHRCPCRAPCRQHRPLRRRIQPNGRAIL